MPKLIDLTGKNFNRLTVIKRAEKNSSSNSPQWECKCSCGNPEIIIVDGAHLRSGHTKSCGCLQKEKARITMKEKIQPLGAKAKANDLVGQTFGYLTVLELSETDKVTRKRLWNCKCKCGNIKNNVSSSDLVTGHTSSCGCLKISLGELKIKTILENNQIIFEQEKQFQDCIYKNKLKFDFYINSQYLIEFDGIQHFQSGGGWNTENTFKETQIKDNIKNEYCRNNNIPLIRIPYTHYEDLCLEDLLLKTTKYRVV